MEFSRQEYWSGLPFLSPEELPNPGIEPWSPASQADSLPFELQEVLTPRSFKDFPGGSEGKQSACSAGDRGLIPAWGRSSGERNGNPLQYSCLGNPMGRGVWQATVRGATESWTQLSD